MVYFEDIRFFYMGKELRNDRNVEDFGIKEGMVI